MIVYLVKADGSKEEYDNVIEFSANKIVCKAGRGKLTMFAGEGEYFSQKENK